MHVRRARSGLPPVEQAGERLAGAEIIALDTAAFVERRSEVAVEYDELLRLGTQAPG